MFPIHQENTYGSLRNYTIGDVTARFYRNNNYNVMHPMGGQFWNASRKCCNRKQSNPKDWTEQNIKNMKKQLKSIGLSIDWSREISTCSKDYYKHQQKLFLDFFNAGIVYKKDSYVTGILLTKLSSQMNR